MKTLTHFTVENERQLEVLYYELKDQMTEGFAELKEKFQSGITTLQCNSIGLVSLDKELLPQSKAIPNPFAEEKQAVVQKPEAPKLVTSNRRTEIDLVLHNIGLEIEDQKLDKLIEVIDLHNDKAGDITIEDIFSLRD